MVSGAWMFIVWPAALHQIKKLRLEGISEKCNYKSGDSCTVSQWLIIVHNLHSMFTLGLIWAWKNENTNKTFFL